MKMISIIVPCLNEEDHLPYFLDSLIIQRNPFELIVIDGGSTDHSRQLIDSFRERIQILGLIDETRNLGYVRNKGAYCARGDPLLFTNSDAVLPAGFLENISTEFQKDKGLLALTGRTVPWEGGILCRLAYASFDLLRWGFSKIGRFSPSGNFLALRAFVFWAVGGFPHCRVNEDGELGTKLSEYSRRHGGKLKFHLGLYTGHWAVRFQKGFLKTLWFYAYVFGNFSPHLKRLLKKLQTRSSREFH
jgi:glycosyltransferase involved in cell wall biosynthesis